MPKHPQSLTRPNLTYKKATRAPRSPSSSEQNELTRPKKHRPRERQRIIDLPDTNTSSTSTFSNRDPASHQSVSLGPSSFTSPPLLPGLVEQIRSLLGSKAKPTPVQALSLTHFFHDRNKIVGPKDPDVEGTLLAAETGSGKSLAYLLPVVQALKASEGRKGLTSDDTLATPRALVLVPTHELGRQVKATLSHLTHAPDTKLRSVCVSSGNAVSLSPRDAPRIQPQENELDSGELRIEAPVSQGSRSVDVVVGTPARILDLTRAGGRYSVGPRRPGDEETRKREVQRDPKMSLQAIEWIVVDEADVLFGTHTKCSS